MAKNAHIFTSIATIAFSGLLACATETSPPGVSLRGTCAPSQTTLLKLGQFDVGTVSLNVEEGQAELTVGAADGYSVAGVRAYVGSGPVPTNAEGGPDLAAFNLSYSGDPQAQVVITGDVGATCGEDLNVSVRVLLQPDGGGNLVVAWAAGEAIFTKPGTVFVHSVCCEELGCSLTQGYWKTHHSDAENRGLRRAWPISEDTSMCGQTWLDILNTPTNGDAWYILAHQWIAASLNVASGASDASVADALDDGAELLSLCALTAAQRDAAIALSEQLDAYNNGEIGPGHCEDQELDE